MSVKLRPDDPLLSSNQVRMLCGNVTKMTLHRWREQMDFPEPLTINTRNYWQLSEVNTWLATTVKK